MGGDHLTGQLSQFLGRLHCLLHGASFLNAPVPHLLPKHVSRCPPVLLDILLTREISPAKCQVDATVKETAGIMGADCTQLGRIQREIQAIPVFAEDTIVDLFNARPWHLLQNNTLGFTSRPHRRQHLRHGWILQW